MKIPQNFKKILGLIRRLSPMGLIRKMGRLKKERLIPMILAVILIAFGLFLFLTLNNPETAQAALAFDATSSTSGTSVSSLTWSHTVTGTNTVLVVGVSIYDPTLANRTVSSVTYNSVNLTKIKADDYGNLRVELWYLANPTTGANNAVVTFGSTVYEAVTGAVTFTGADQTNPIDDFNSSVGYSGAQTVPVTPVADNVWIVDVVASYGTSLTPDGAQTQRWNARPSSLSGGGSTRGPITPQAETSMSWTAGANYWTQASVSVRPVQSASADTRQNYYMASDSENLNYLTTFQDKVWLTFTPDANSTYFLIATWQIKTGASSVAVTGQFLNATTGLVYSTSTTGSVQSADYYSQTGLAVQTFGASPTAQTYKIQSKSSSVDYAVSMKNARIIAIKADTLDQNAQSLTQSTTASATYQDKTTLTFTPATAGDYFIIAAADLGYNTNFLPYIQMLVNATAFGTIRDLDTGNDNARYAWSTMQRVTFTTDSQSIKIQYHSDGSNTANIQNATVIAIRADRFNNNYYNESTSRDANNTASFTSKATVTQTPVAANHLVLGSGIYDIGSTGSVAAKAQLVEGSTVRNLNISQTRQIYYTSKFSMFTFYKKAYTAASTTWSTQWASGSAGTNAYLADSAVLVIELNQVPPTPRSATIPNEGLLSHGASSVPGWYNAAWGYRRSITVDRLKVTDAAGTGLTNFPMLFSRTDPDLRDTGSGGKVASSTAGDIVFIDWEGNKINHEIDQYDNTAGQLIAWVQMPFVSATSTRTIYMYYGNAAAAYQPTNSAAWDANYKGVWHLGNGATLTANDSTSYGDNGVLSGTPPTAAPGKIGGGADFDGANNYIDLPSEQAVSPAFTFSTWERMDVTPAANLFMIDYQPNGSAWKFGVGTSRRYYWYKGSAGTKIASPNSGLVYVVWVITSDNDLELFLNGQSKGKIGNTTAFTTADGNSKIGANNDATGKWDGLIDELRISSTNRSADWIATEYANQASPNTFYLVGGQETSLRSNPDGTTKAPIMKARGGVKFR